MEYSTESLWVQGTVVILWYVVRLLLLRFIVTRLCSFRVLDTLHIVFSEWSLSTSIYILAHASIQLVKLYITSWFVA